MSRKKTNISVRLDEVCEHLPVTNQNDLGKRYGVKQQTISNFTIDGKPGWRITTGLIRDGISVDWIMAGVGEMLREDKAPSVEPVDVSLTGALILLELFAQNPDRQRDILSTVRAMVDPEKSTRRPDKPNRPGKRRTETK